MDFEEKIENFAYEHPFWTWALARLAICICGCTIAALALSALVVIATPFVLIADGADSLSIFGVWILLPLIATVIWLCGSVIGYVWQELIE